VSKRRKPPTSGKPLKRDGQTSSIIEWAVRPREPDPEPLGPLPDRRSYTEEEALAVLWSAKNLYVPGPDGLPQRGEDGKFLTNPNWVNAFVYATLGRDAEMSLGQERPHTAKKGTRVLVTMVSRFGDVGIRDDHLEPPSNGYYTRVMPEDLTDWGSRA
jgi:hypothetical protein